jgi:hypothetical protein
MMESEIDLSLLIYHVIQMKSLITICHLKEKQKEKHRYIAASTLLLYILEIFHAYTLRTTFVCERSGPTEKIDNGIPVN